MYIKQRDPNKHLADHSPLRYLPMAISPESSGADRNHVDFRAPPPSPIASGRRSSVTNDDILTDFLEHSLRVPDLILLDQIFPRQISIPNPPKIDFRRLKSPGNDDLAEILDCIARVGCFQLVNHGITREFIRSVLTAGAEIFRLSPDKKAVVSRSPEKSYGFEEFQGDDEREMSEEFVWCRDQGLKLEMEGIWPLGYSNFSAKIERLMLEIEKVAENFLLVLKEHSMRNPICGIGMTQGQEISGSICYIYKHYCCNISGDQRVNSLSYDVIRMLVRGSDYSHALCLHLCDGSSDFHVYSKKGWGSFCPDEDAIVITVGDQIQAWSGRRYKQVIGKPIFNGEVEEECISMAFLYSPTSISHSFKAKQGKTISIAQQAIIAILLTLLYQILVYVCKL